MQPRHLHIREPGNKPLSIGPGSSDTRPLNGSGVTLVFTEQLSERSNNKPMFAIDSE